ncbi:MAG: xanthine dehydrogenase family protein subunit M [Pseudomonadota bacterium]
MSAVERFAAPRSLQEALEILRAGEVTVLAGGTDLMPQSHSGKLPLARVLMSVRRVPELQGITETEGTIRIGAATTIRELRASGLVRGRLPILWQACDRFASDQVRNAATIGGNVCNASPAGDTLVPLLVLEAQAVLVSKPDGAIEERRLPLAEFFLAPGRTRRQPEELLRAIEVPTPPANFVSEFYKFGTRPALDISAISIGFGAVREGGVLRQVRIALGAVAPTPMRASRAEAALEGAAPDEQALAAAAAAALEETRPISDVRASDWYRRELVRNMLPRVVRHACES